MTTALVLGDARCVFADAEAALKLFTPDLVAACNNIGLKWGGRVDHWFTLHPKPITDWVGIEAALKRRCREKRNAPVTWAHKPGPGIDLTTDDWAGSTGLFAVKGMLEVGCRRIVLAGVPLTETEAHYYSDAKWTQARCYHKGWLRHVDEISPYVRSMSGWTRELLGLPTREWLEPSKGDDGNAEVTYSR